MAVQPSASQCPQMFHPDFEQEVFMIVFLVDGQGFKVDAARLSQHLKFLKDMFSGTRIGMPQEGSIDHSIVVSRCTAAAFANFLGWLNHNSWAQLDAEHAEQLLDILHISHMWDIKPGIDFASTELLESKFGLCPAHCLHLAQRYSLLAWIPAAIWSLLSAPLKEYTQADRQHLCFELYSIIATTKESIDTERKRLGVFPPYPKNIDDAPYCNQHSQCTKIWIEKWYFIILRRIHHASDPLPISSLIKALEDIDHRGMKGSCKDYILTWLKTSNNLDKEEQLIQDTIDTVHRMFS